MENTIHFTVLVVLIKAIYAQEIEDAALRQMLSKTTLAQCMTPPKLAGAPQRCCNVPQLFENETTVGCEPINLLEGKPALRGSPDCADRNCVLRNNDLLNDNDQIDKESFKQYLDEWVSKRKEFLSAIEEIKEDCLGKKPLLGSSTWCEADKLVFCVGFNMISRCPNWLQNEGCAEIRSYLDNCVLY